MSPVGADSTCVSSFSLLDSLRPLYILVSSNCMFGADVYVKRVALTMNQIETYNPPPNPAKLSDSRCGKYIDEYGDESWELDALEPSVITNLITNEVTAFRDDEIYQAVCDLEKRGKEELKMIERNYDRAVAFLESEV